MHSHLKHFVVTASHSPVGSLLSLDLLLTKLDRDSALLLRTQRK